MKRMTKVLTVQEYNVSNGDYCFKDENGVNYSWSTKSEKAYYELGLMVKKEFTFTLTGVTFKNYEQETFHVIKNVRWEQREGVFQGSLYSNKARDYYMDKIMEIASLLFDDLDFRTDGAYIVSGDIFINIYDYIEEYYEKELRGELETYVKRLIMAQQER